VDSAATIVAACHTRLMRTPHRHDDRGLSLSVLLACCVLALLLAAGLAVDGAIQAEARRSCQIAAATLARLGADASATDRLGGLDGHAAALGAARDAAAQRFPDLDVTVSIDAAGSLQVSASTRVATVFLELIGVKTLPASGRASADLRWAAPG